MDTGSTPPVAVVQVPPLEPPAPLAARLRPRGCGWIAARWRESPCWLASMVIHLAIIIVLGSLTLPQVSRRWIGNLVAHWSLAEESEEPEAEVAATLLTVEAQEPQLPLARAPEDFIGAAPPENLADIDPLAAGPGQLSQPLGQVSRERDSRREADNPRSDNARYDETVSRFIEYDIGRLPGAAGERARRGFDALGPEAIPALVRGLNRAACLAASCPVLVIASKLNNSLARNTDPSLLEYALDNIGRDVPDDAFHIDRIRGLHERWLGIRQQRIDALRRCLGPHVAEITPAMQQRYQAMYGANAATLAKALGEGPAPLRMATLAAALDRPDERWPGEKPLLARALIPLLEHQDAAVASLAEDVLLKLADGEPPLEDGSEGKVASWTRHWEEWGAMQKLASHTVSELGESLDAADPKTRWAACAVVQRRAGEWNDHELLLVARLLTDRLVDDDPVVRRRADRAMRRLAEEAGAEAKPVAGNADGTAAVRYWRAEWDRFQRERLIEPRAGSFLSMAQLLEERGQTEVARKRYQQIVTDFPGTTAALVAQQRLRQGAE